MLPSRKRRSNIVPLIVAGLLCASTGCASLMNSTKRATRTTTRMFTPNGRDYNDGTDDDGSEWDFVGDEGRADTDREKDVDPWFKQHLMSDKARSIERNLGLD